MLDLLLITSGNAGGHIAHLGGALAGLWFAVGLSKGHDRTAWINRMLDALKSLVRPGRRKPKMKLRYGGGGGSTAGRQQDYDYNAPSAEHLEKTHEPFFQAVRKANPDLPIIMLSKCSWISPRRRDIIRKTYENARKAGDKKVWFIDGSELFGEPGQNMCTVDHCHPNDLGFYMMHRRVLPVLKEALAAGK